MEHVWRLRKLLPMSAPSRSLAPRGPRADACLASRRTVLRLGAAATLAAAFPARTRAGAPLKVRLLVGRDQSLCHLPLIVARELGYFAAEGLDVTLAEGHTPAQAARALQSGGAQFVSGAYLHVVLRQLQGEAVQSVVVEGRSPIVAFGVSKRQLPEFRGVADLRGRRVGTSAPGTLPDLLARVLLIRAGLRPEEVRWTPLDSGSEAVFALRAGRVDALSHVDPGMTQLEQKGDVRLVADTRTVKGARELFGGLLPGTCVYASTGYVERHAEVCQAMANAVLRGLKWLQTAQPQDLIATVPDAALGEDRALYLASFYKVRESYSVDGALSSEALKATAGVAAALADVPASQLEAALERSHTNDFAAKARAKWFRS